MRLHDLISIHDDQFFVFGFNLKNSFQIIYSISYYLGNELSATVVVPLEGLRSVIRFKKRPLNFILNSSKKQHKPVYHIFRLCFGTLTNSCPDILLLENMKIENMKIFALENISPVVLRLFLFLFDVIA